MANSLRIAGWACWRAAVLQLREITQVKITLVISVVQPVVFLMLVLYGRQHPDPRYATRMLVGSVMVALWSATLWGTGTLLRREIAQGTFAAILARPAPILVVLLGKTLGVALAGLVRTAAATGAIVLALRVHVLLPNPGVLVLIAATAVASSAALGILLASLVLLTRGGLRIIEALSYPVFVFGGLMVPLDMLPPPLRWPAGLISLHYVVEMVDTAVRGDLLAGRELAAALLLTIVYLASGAWALRAVLDRGRKAGTLELA